MSRSLKSLHCVIEYSLELFRNLWLDNSLRDLARGQSYKQWVSLFHRIINDICVKTKKVRLFLVPRLEIDRLNI